ncbi:MAG: phospholipase D-like domain-containing protein, partial [Saprospiraceae bacterium]
IFGLHAKSMVVDEQITVIGTFNLDPRSAHLNTECITVVHDKKMANKVLSGFEEEFRQENAWETTKNWNPDHKVNIKKRAGTFVRRIVPKSIL